MTEVECPLCKKRSLEVTETKIACTIPDCRYELYLPQISFKDKVLILALGETFWLTELIEENLNKIKLQTKTPGKIVASEDNFDDLAKLLHTTIEAITTKKIKVTRESEKHLRILEMIDLLLEKGIVCNELLNSHNPLSIGKGTIRKSMKNQDLFTELSLRKLTKYSVRTNATHWNISRNFAQFKKVTKYFIDKDLYFYYVRTAYFRHCWNKYKNQIRQQIIRHKEIFHCTHIFDDEVTIVRRLMLLSPSAMKYALSEDLYPGQRPSSFFNIISYLKPETKKMDELVRQILYDEPPKKYSEYTYILLNFLITDLVTNEAVRYLLPGEAGIVAKSYWTEKDWIEATTAVTRTEGLCDAYDKLFKHAGEKVINTKKLQGDLWKHIDQIRQKQKMEAEQAKTWSASK